MAGRAGADRADTGARMNGSRPERPLRPEPASGPAVPEPSTQADQAYQALKQQILDNRLPPGTQLLEQESARLLGMSRTPVREAMVRLSHEGLVELRPRHGMRVLPISPDDMEEIYQILTALEAAAAEIVAAKPISERGIDQLKQALKEMTKALEADDLLAWASADELFHKLLIDRAGNRRLAALVNLHWEQAHRVRLATLHLRLKPTSSMEDHAALLEAIEAGRPGTAFRVHRAHRRRSGKMLVALLRQHGLRHL